LIVKDKEPIIPPIKKVTVTQNVINNIIPPTTANPAINFQKSSINKLDLKSKMSISPLKIKPDSVQVSAPKDLKANLNLNITIINNQITPPVPKKKDAETQTEDIFFKSHWTYFQSKNYTILSCKVNTKLSATNQLPGDKKYQMPSSTKLKNYSTEKKPIFNNSSISSSMNLNGYNQFMGAMDNTEIAQTKLNQLMNNRVSSSKNRLGNMNNLTSNVYKSNILSKF
jgi:hypothetical protein